MTFAFPSLESETMILKRGFYIVDQKMRPEHVQRFGRGFIHLHALSRSFLTPSGQAGLVPPQLGPQGAVAEHKHPSQTQAASSAPNSVSLLLWVFGGILSLSFTPVL